MAGNPPDIHVQLLPDNVVNTVPYSTGVYIEGGSAVTLTWKASVGGTEFPDGTAGNPYFKWKPGGGPPGGTLPTRSGDGKTLTLNYTMPTSRQLWEYTIWIKQTGATAIGEDPEVDNRPPSGGGGGDETHGGGKSKKP